MTNPMDGASWSPRAQGRSFFQIAVPAPGPSQPSALGTAGEATAAPAAEYFRIIDTFTPMEGDHGVAERT
ncbi:hypothetical protein, partial [Catenulispora rubra]|uniref:hypothetical protein n=1 Tax=Catenulispora rubra TaxID=280293 RepID=UPI001E39D177